MSSANLLGAALYRLHAGRPAHHPVWAAWASPSAALATILIFPIHNDVFQQTFKYLVCALSSPALPAAWARPPIAGDQQAASQA